MAASRDSIETTLRALNAAENSRELSPAEKSAALDVLATPDVRGWSNGASRGDRDAERAAEAFLFSAIPDYQRDLIHILIDPPHAAVTWRMTGTVADGAPSRPGSSSFLAHPMRRSLVVIPMVLAVFVGISCGSTEERRALVAYAEGEWSCQDQAFPDAIVAAVNATDDAEGRVEITFPWSADPFSDPEGEDLVVAGDWRLDDEELAVRWDDSRWGSAEVAPISLDAEEIRTRSGSDDEVREWVTVNVDRTDRSITFDAELPYEGRLRLRCEKT